VDQGVEYGRWAVILDETDGQCHSGLASCLLFKRQFEQAGRHSQRAVALNPSDALILASYCHWLSRVGRVDEAWNGLDNILQRQPFPARLGLGSADDCPDQEPGGHRTPR
jgi:Flp pilus assembly protein TadD